MGFIGDENKNKKGKTMAMKPYKRRLKRGKIKQRFTRSEKTKLVRERRKNKNKLKRDRKKYYRKNRANILRRQKRRRNLNKNRKQQVKNPNFRYTYK